MLKVYFFTNFILYLLLALWCVISPVSTAAFVGFTTTSIGGQSEWLAVFGGLQGGIGLFFLHAAWQTKHSNTALLLACYLYFGLVALRFVTVFQYGFTALGNAQVTLCLELTLLIWAIFLRVRHR
jgi:hypothetical protein